MVSVSSIQDALRALTAQVSLLNQQVGGRLDLRPVDRDCLYLISRHAPMTPSALAKLTGLHPATMTGVLDRLEKGGWIARERDPHDRRAVLIRPLPRRVPEIVSLYAGMTRALDEICAGYSPEERALLLDFITKVTDAATTAKNSL
ncbi:MarR family transcriptional regulator [Herbidospora sp. NBRC 101105]|uniref:MarR family winged helix-turn-helix transcriptional regulator n=1 Tax=Herbidospora sp. NBRC 101105 TaxID=3032195 RepID=UPI0024A55A66|nr:MarR family transcriptional regulator [Herbidospora sp. NBRC 101105]GLX93857.1 MarR family transcriptional regulator [Herbidospora sp. NBRC 101105]